MGDFELPCPVNFIYLNTGENESFDHFFENSFIHHYIRSPDNSDLSYTQRLKLAQSKANQIQYLCKFIVSVDKEDPSVFYGYTAYFHDNDTVTLMFAYIKRNLRGFGIYKEALDIICTDCKYFSCVYPERNSKKLDKYTRRYI